MKNNVYKIVTVAFTATVMQSCFVAKDYERPKDIKTENLYRTEVVSKDSTSMANLSWDKVFTDPILQGYIRKGLENNLDIRIAMQNIAAADAGAGCTSKAPLHGALRCWCCGTWPE